MTRFSLTFIFGYQGHGRELFHKGPNWWQVNLPPSRKARYRIALIVTHHGEESKLIPETLLFMNEGPMVRYLDNTLHIEDLNPQINLHWRMSTKELLVFGLRCVRRAIQVDAGVRLSNLRTKWGRK